MAIEFISAKELSPEESERIEKLNVLIKEKRVPIANQDLFRPSDVLQELSERVPYKVTMQTHTSAWKFFEVRPSGVPEGTPETKSLAYSTKRIKTIYIHEPG